ncbi:cytochrome P450, partial [Pseudomonas aeruginosa]
MSTSPASALDPKNNYTAVSETYRGTHLDMHVVCREQLLKSPIYKGDFITQFGVPTNAGIQQGTGQTFALFKY